MRRSTVWGRLAEVALLALSLSASGCSGQTPTEQQSRTSQIVQAAAVELELPDDAYMVATTGVGQTFSTVSQIVVSAEGTKHTARLAVIAENTTRKQGGRFGLNVDLSPEQTRQLVQWRRTELDASALVGLKLPRGAAERQVVALTLTPNDDSTISIDMELRKHPLGKATALDDLNRITLKGELPIECWIIDPENHSVKEDPMLRVPECASVIKEFGLEPLVDFSRG